MKTIWKYTLQIKDGQQRLMIPGGGRVVHVAMQNDLPTIWVEIYPEEEEKPSYFLVYGTGHPISRGVHIGTCISESLVWHIYQTSGEKKP